MSVSSGVLAPNQWLRRNAARFMYGDSEEPEVRAPPQPARSRERVARAPRGSSAAGLCRQTPPQPYQLSTATAAACTCCTPPPPRPFPAFLSDLRRYLPFPFFFSSSSARACQPDPGSHPRLSLCTRE